MTAEEHAVEKLKKDSNTYRRKIKIQELSSKFSGNFANLASLSTLDSEVGQLLQPCFACHRLMDRPILRVFKREKFAHTSQDVLNKVLQCYTDATGLEAKFMCTNCAKSLESSLIPIKCPVFPFAASFTTQRLLQTCRQPASMDDLCQVFYFTSFLFSFLFSPYYIEQCV
jgi:transcription elongation factor Elf1